MERGDSGFSFFLSFFLSFNFTRFRPKVVIYTREERGADADNGHIKFYQKYIELEVYKAAGRCYLSDKKQISPGP